MTVAVLARATLGQVSLANSALAGPSARRIPIWAVVAAGGVIAAISLGVRSTFGLFIDPIADTVGSGRAAISLVIAVQNLIWGLSQPLAGAVSDKFGAARTIALGVVLWCLSMLLMSTAGSEGMVLLSGGVLGGLAVGAASFSVILSSVGRMVAPERRAMTLGIISAVGSIGQFILIPITQRILDRSSWQDAAVVLAVIAATAIVLTPALRGKAADFPDLSHTAAPDRTLRQEFRRATSNRSYQYLNAAFFVCGFHVTFIGTHLKPYVNDLGQSGATAANALALIGLFNVFGSLAAGSLGSRYSNTKLLAGIYGMRAVVIAIYLFVPASANATIIFGIAIGMLWLATVPLTGAIVTMQFGTAHAGALFGLVFLSHQIGSFIGAFVGGWIADSTGSYAVMWWIAVALGVIAMAFHLGIDEGPVPEEPETRGGIRLAPATIVLLLGFGILSVFARPAVSEAAGSSAVAFCDLTRWVDSSPPAGQD